MKASTIEPGAAALRVGDSHGHVTPLPDDPLHDREASPHSASAVAGVESDLLDSPSVLVPNARAVNLGVLVDQAAVSVTSFVASIIVGRTCGSAELGAFSLAVSIFWLVAGIPNALVWTPYVTRFAHLPRARRRLFLGSVTSHLLGLAIVIALLFVVSSWVPWPGLAGKPWFTPLCLAMVPFTIMMLMREHLRRVHLAHLVPGSLLQLDLPVGALQIALVAALAWTGKLSADTALLAMAAGCAPALIYLILRRSEFPLFNPRTRIHLGHNFNFGRWLLVMSVTWLLGDAALRWFVGSFHGRAELGRFAAAYTAVLFINPLVLTIQNLARSYASRTVASEGIQGLLPWTFRQSSLIALGAGGILMSIAMVGNQLVALLYGSEFTGLGPVVAWLCVGVFLQVLTVPPEAALSALQDGKAILQASTVRLALILAAGIPLVWKLQSVGVGITLALSSLATVFALWHLLRRRCIDA